MSNQITALINQLTREAKARGMTQAALAESAGMSAVGLSKAKHRGDIRASLLAALAERLDLELALVPRRSRDKAVAAIKAGNLFGSAAGTGGEGPVKGTSP